jgi:Fe-S-cluster-containing hydrogenase component 2
MHVNSTRCPANHPCPALRSCPVGAITQKGYGLPVINKELCIECGKCARVCPMRAITM